MTALTGLALLWATAVPAAAWHRRCWDCDIPFQWEDDDAPPPVDTPYTQGFVLTVPIAPGQRRQPSPEALNRYVDVGHALGQCLSADLSRADARWSDLTLRVSFKRDGTVNGVPRIAHVSATSSEASDPEAEERGRDKVLSVLPHCTPLAFSPSLGRAVAGQIFAIRFVQQRNS